MGYLITGVRIFDGTGREPFPGVVRVEGDRITEVAAHFLSAFVPAAERLEREGHVD